MSKKEKKHGITAQEILLTIAGAKPENYNEDDVKRIRTALGLGQAEFGETMIKSSHNYANQLETNPDRSRITGARAVILAMLDLAIKAKEGVAEVVEA